MQMLMAPVRRWRLAPAFATDFCPPFAVGNAVQAADLRLDNIAAQCEHNCNA
jgi:hypothetical protein